MNVLFGRDEDPNKPAKSVASRQEDEEAYETVREGNTSDTTEAPQDGSRRSLAIEKTAQEGESANSPASPEK